MLAAGRVDLVHFWVEKVDGQIAIWDWIRPFDSINTNTIFIVDVLLILKFNVDVGLM